MQINVACFIFVTGELIQTNDITILNTWQELVWQGI
jgi:hypothetical protein